MKLQSILNPMPAFRGLRTLALAAITVTMLGAAHAGDPVPADLSTGTTVFDGGGLPIGTVKTLYPSAQGSDGASSFAGSLYLRAKLTGAGITSANDDCILHWDGFTATALMREGSTAFGPPIGKLGDPVVNPSGDTIAYTVRFADPLLEENNVTRLFVTRADIPGSGIEIMTVGFAAPGAGGRKFTAFTWVYWTTNGLLVGATAKDEAATPKGISGVWTAYPHSLAPVVLPGDAVTVNGTPSTVKSISKPTAKKPAASQTRMGNDESISLLIKTTDGDQVIKRFVVPVGT